MTDTGSHQHDLILSYEQKLRAVDKLAAMRPVVEAVGVWADKHGYCGEDDCGVMGWVCERPSCRLFHAYREWEKEQNNA